MKKTFKKLAALVLAMSLCLTMGVSSFAAENNNSVTATQVETRMQPKNFQYNDVLDARLRSLSPPSQFWDLSNNNNYNADIAQLSISWLYTNYYFKPYSDGKIHVDFTIYSDTGRACPLKVACYDMSQKKFVAQFTSANATYSGISESWEFNGLSPNTNYAIAFMAGNDRSDPMHGSATIIQH